MSAVKYREHWANTRTNPLGRAWLNAGYYVARPDMKERSVVFRRKENPCPRQKRNGERFAVTPKRTDCKMTEERAVRLIKTYLGETERDQNGRYLSWRHCYCAFMKYRGAEEEEAIDYPALHLGFYLASWGMYRGSSFLLQKDYKVHLPVVRFLAEQRYDSLVCIAAQDLCKEENLRLLEELGERIAECYAKQTPSRWKSENHATDTLVTKILLGTLGCVPAYDRYYKDAVKREGVSSDCYSSLSIRQVARFYIDHLDTLEALRREIGKCGVTYPPMKLMDMCFWQDGYEFLLENQL